MLKNHPHTPHSPPAETLFCLKQHDVKQQPYLAPSVHPQSFLPLTQALKPICSQGQIVRSVGRQLTLPTPLFLKADTPHPYIAQSKDSADVTFYDQLFTPTVV